MRVVIEVVVVFSITCKALVAAKPGFLPVWELCDIFLWMVLTTYLDVRDAKLRGAIRWVNENVLNE